MLEITYRELLAVITVLWIAARIIIRANGNKISAARELKLLMVYICIIVIMRIVDFPWHLTDGHIGTLKFDASKIFPLWLNLIPIVHLFDIYDGWKLNVFGNIAMFIPVGIVWPVCFKKLDTVGKTVLAGFIFTLSIEISQLLFYERCSDIDDIILNTAGTFIGALLYFGIRKLIRKRS